uniref:Uncharacterized protein n=1 Tax=Rhizophora mucronata TaxID=61149 RepID=A0A2P2PYI5_RHIMU
MASRTKYDYAHNLEYIYTHKSCMIGECVRAHKLNQS